MPAARRADRVVLVDLGGVLRSDGTCGVAALRTPVSPRPAARRTWGGYPGRTGGPWLCRTLVLSGFHAVVVPSGFRTSVQPHRWMTTWW